jgi:hypothetical protein
MTSPEQYTPRNYSELDWIAAAKRTADAIMRSNPLTNAVITKGLTQWRGNHVDVNGDKVEFLWIGDFLPPDPTLGNIPQKGIVFRRDDSTASGVNDGRMAFALYDHDPGGNGLGLRQTIHWDSLDGFPLYREAREGGQDWPEHPVPMGPWGNDTSKWPGTTVGTATILWIGWGNIVGKNLVAEYTGAGEGSATSEYWVEILTNGGPPIVGPVHGIGVGAFTSFKDEIDVSSIRGETRQVRLYGRVTGGAGRAAASAWSFRCYT